MRRLYWQVYLTFIGILVLFGLLLSLAFLVTPSDDRRGHDALARVAEELLPRPDAPPAEIAAALERIAARVIPDRERERIFEPFFRGENAKASDEDGVGLGLAIVQRIAHLHGGQVRCVPRPDGGSRFEVELGAGDY